MHDWRVGGWEKLGKLEKLDAWSEGGWLGEKSKKGCNQRGRQHLGKGMSDEYWGRPRLAPYSCEPAKKEYVIESVVFLCFRLWVMCSLLIFLRFIPKFSKTGCFLKKCWKENIQSPILWGWVLPPGRLPYHCLSNIFTTLVLQWRYIKSILQMWEKKLISINVQKQNISYVLD